jgi:DNA-binding response OmpR family regulator
MYEDLTVLVVDRDERCRAALVTALRRLGLRALGLTLPDEAVGLLDGIDAEIALVRSDGGDDEPAIAELKRRTPLVLVTPARASTEETVVELLRALGRPDEAAHLN